MIECREKMGAVVVEVFLVSCASIGGALLVAAGGVYLANIGVITGDVKKGLSGLTSRLCVPCLLFNRLTRTVSWEMLAETWLIIPFAAFYVGLGCALGKILTSAVGTPPEQVRATIAAIAFANSQGLPIMMVEVIGPALFDEEAAEVGVAYVAMYLVLYLCLQWTVGAALMGVPVDMKPMKPAAANPAATSNYAPVTAVDAYPSPTSSKEALEVIDTGLSVVVELVHSSDIAEESSQQEAEAVSTLAVPVRSKQSSQWWAVLCGIAKRVGVPPVYAICLGVVAGLSPQPFHAPVLVGEAAPMGWAMQAPEPSLTAVPALLTPASGPGD